jgi:hypothetical protein
MENLHQDLALKEKIHEDSQEFIEYKRFFLSIFIEEMRAMQERQLARTKRPGHSILSGEDIVIEEDEMVRRLGLRAKGTKLNNFSFKIFLKAMQMLQSVFNVDAFTDVACTPKDMRDQYLTGFMTKKTRLKIARRDLRPYYLDESFGDNISQGYLEIDETCGYSFSRMSGGFVRLGSNELNSANSGAFATGMEGGTIIAKKVKGDVLTHMKGGTAIIETAMSDEILTNCQGGTCFIKNLLPPVEGSESHLLRGSALLFNDSEYGTYVIENMPKDNTWAMDAGISSPLVLVKSKSSDIRIAKDEKALTIVCYEEDMDRFVTTLGIGKINDIGDDPALLNSFCHMRAKGQVAKIRLGEKYNNFPYFTDMRCGILIVKEAKVEKLGIGMEGGFLILDDPNLSLERAREICVPQEERKGGVILYLKKWTEGKVFKKKKAEFIVI